MLYCYDKDLPFDYSKSEMAISKLNNNGILYDSSLKIFTDYSGNQIDIKGKIILPRTGVKQIYEMNNEIIKNGGIPVCSNQEIDLVIDWPKYYPNSRKTSILKGHDLIDLATIDKIEKDYSTEIFLKTKDKNFNGVIETELLKDSECAFYKTLNYHLDEEFIISEKVDIMCDSYGKKEYRCFIINNEVYNISRLTTTLFHSIDMSIYKKALQIVDVMKDKFPSCYVVDLFEYQLNGKEYIDVVEFNPINAAGLYLYNSAIEKSKDMLHFSVKNIAHEFIEKIDECSFEGYVINERMNLYDVSKSFSNDLRSICLTGKVGMLWSTYSGLSAEDFKRHSGIFSSFFTPIEDDDLLEQEEDDYITDEELELLEKVKVLIKEHKSEF